MNWMNEVKKYEADFKKDLKALVAIPSLKDDTTISEKAPFGQGCREALDKMMEIAKGYGFTVKDIDGYACAIEYGEGEESVGMLAHLDIVPIGENWTHDPLGCEEVNGVIYGRGTLDDKGPAVAGLTALRMIKDSGVKLNKKLMLICGCDEESGMECMKYYCDHAEIPTMSFTPDAEFPVVYAEKGICIVNIEGKIDSPIISMNAGERSNVVIGKASALVADFDDEKVDAFDFYLRSHHLEGSIEYTSEGTLLTIEGAFAHASLPWLGVNAGMHLLNFIGAAYENETCLDLYSMLSDWRGSGSHIDKNGAYMGFLTANVGIIRIENNELKIVIDHRYPNDTNAEAILEGYTATLAEYGSDLKAVLDHDTHPLFLNPNSEMIQTLMDAYRQYSGDDFTPAMVMGGGTYAKKLPNCVAFGPEFPCQRTACTEFVGGPHQADEGIILEDMMAATAIYAEALVKLGS